MDDQRSNRIIKALLIAGLFLGALIISLALLLAMAFYRAVRSIEETNKRIDNIQRSIVLEKTPEVDYEIIAAHITERVNKAIAELPLPKDGSPGQKGQDGKDGITPACYLEIGQCQGPRGIPGISPRQIEFDGNGHWRFLGDDEWLPLFKNLPKEPTDE